MSTLPFIRKPAAPALPPQPVAPPPPPVVAAPPPPPPAPVPAPTVAYEARDPVFYAYAACILAAALQPPGFQPADHEQANTTGDALARLLDKGIVPKGCIIASRVIVRRAPDGERFKGEGAPEAAPLLDLVSQKEALAATRAGQGVGGARHAPMMTAAQQAEAEKRLQWAGGDKLPTRKEAEDSAAAAGEALADISEPVRLAALHMAYGRILLRNDVTGAPHRLQDAVDIVVAEIDRARAMFAARGLPVRALRSEEEAAEQGSAAFPYPANLGIDMLSLAFSGMPDLTAYEARLASLEDHLAKMAVPAVSEEPAK